MKLTKIRLTSYYWTSVLGKMYQTPRNIDLPIGGAQPSDSYIVRDITGLGPPDLNVLIGTSIKVDGGYYKGRQINDREIVATVGLNPNYANGETYESLRENLYSLLTSGDEPIRVGLYEGSVEKAFTTGHISKFEIAVFQASPAIQITIKCPSALFDSNENVKLVVGSSAGAGQAIVINSAGNAPSGIRLSWTMVADAPGVDVTIGQHKFSLTNSYKEGDRLALVTIPRQRSITLYRGTNVYNNLHRVNATSTWVQVYPGAQNLIISQPANQIEIEYTPSYWGV